MLVLAVDTSTEFCSAALVEENRVVSEITNNRGLNHSSYIFEIIDATLNFAGFKLSDIDGFAVTLGPGTFTGLRVGISAIKGLAAPTDKPVVGVSSLKALAYQVSTYKGLICPMLDARKKQVYTALYRSDKSNFQQINLQSVRGLDTAIQNINEPCLFTGSGAVLYKKDILDKKREGAIFPPFENNFIRASTVARIGIKSIKQGNVPPNISPIYIREPDAKIPA